ncbi:SDR family NAD(P)-dependent oxidoreductase [Marinomonas shanghaiensis]|uniref:SDR family NAD(P)-dependent oxidoreductase n=1 Tax=Marinomonas shanghaiensis TaxID=2202418 RepID=UPI003A8FB38D
MSIAKLLYFSIKRLKQTEIVCFCELNRSYHFIYFNSWVFAMNITKTKATVIDEGSRNIALITGGSRGLGRSAALHLASRGVDTVITFRTNKEEAEAVTNEARSLGGKSIAIQLDVSDTKQFPVFIESLQQALSIHWQRNHFDHLINNAGMGINSSIESTSESQFDELMRVHLKGPFFLTQSLLPFLSDGGSILNISTGLTRFALPGYSAYAMMKGGVEVMTRYMAKELGVRGIRVNTIAPGAIETDFGGGVVRDKIELNQFIASVTALGRAGLPEDIGAVIASLVSEDSRWVNAQRIEVSGGMFI